MRIIAGRWRGRKLAVPCAKGLRPTGDRVRETLFNWLQADIAGAHCLDMFAGSGALGFEALSRYASSVSFVETDIEACQALQQACELLGVELREPPAKQGQALHSTHAHLNPAGTVTDAGSGMPVAHIHSGSAQTLIEQWTQSHHAPAFDLVFIDPPFESACQWKMLAALVPSLLVNGALVYLESPTSQSGEMVLPAGCNLVREKRFGDVMARLVRYLSVPELQEQ